MNGPLYTGDHRRPTPPGKILVDHYLEPRNMEYVTLAELAGLPSLTVARVITGHEGITPEIAKGFAFALGTSPELWLNLQAAVDAWIRDNPE